MKRTFKNALLCLTILLACMPTFGQNMNMIVSGKGQLIDYPVYEYFNEIIYYNTIVLPRITPNMKSVSLHIIQFDRDFKYFSGDDCLITFSYDTLCRIDSISIGDDWGRLYDRKYIFTYLDDKIVEYQYSFDDYGCHYVKKWKYTYNNGLLKSFLHNDSNTTYQCCSTDLNGNATMVNEYHWSSFYAKHTFSYNRNGKKILYTKSDTEGFVEEKITWTYDEHDNLIKINQTKYGNGYHGVYVRSCYEYRFEYGNDGNPKRCVQYEIGDIEIVTGGWDYEYVYTFYPTKEELLRQAEENKRIAEEKRITDSINNVRKLEIERQRIEDLKTAYASCRFLFETETEFMSCIKEEHNETIYYIDSRIEKKISEIKRNVLTGRKLRDSNNPICESLKNICNICKDIDNQEIKTYTEIYLEDFIKHYEFLRNAYYKKVAKANQRGELIKPSDFLLDYMDRK